MSPAIPIARLLVLLAENSGVILTVAGSVSLAYILTRPENKRAIDSSLANLSLAIEQIGNQAATISVPVANNVGRQLDYTRQQLRDFQEKLVLIDKVLPIAKEYLGKVGRLIRKLDQVNTKLSDRVRANPFDSQSVPSTFRDSPVQDFPAVPDVDFRDLGTAEVNRPGQPVPWPKPIPSNPPTSNRQDRAKPNPAPADFPVSPSPDGINWVPVPSGGFPTNPPSDGLNWVPTNRFPLPTGRDNTRRGPRQVPNDIQFGPHPIDNLIPLDITQNVPQAKPISRAKPKPRTDTNQPGCKDPNSWSEKFKQFLEFAIDQLGQELIQTMADRAGEVFEKAFAARDEVIRKNPDFDKGKPDLKKTLEDSIGKEFDKLSPQTKADLKQYYDINVQKDGSSLLSRHKGRANDPTLPPIQIKNGIVIPELLAKSNRLSSGVDLGKEFAKGHGFNPTKSGVLKTASNGQALSQKAAIKDLVGPVQIHHKVTDALWQSHPLTQAMQAKIDAGSKNILGLNDSSNLIAAYKSPEAKAGYQKMLTEIGKTNPQLKVDIERNLRSLESGKAMLSDLYHNGSHDGWSSRAEKVLTEEARILREKFPDLSKVPEKELNEAYRKATKRLGAELYDASEKIRQNQPLSEKEKNWAKEYCNPKDQQNKKPHKKISANPDKDTVQNRLIATTKHVNDPDQKNSNNLLSAALNNQGLQTGNAGQKEQYSSIQSPLWAETIKLANELKQGSNNQGLQVENAAKEIQQGSTRDSVWSETMALAYKLKKANESPVEQHVAVQPPENIKQSSKGGFERG